MCTEIRIRYSCACTGRSLGHHHCRNHTLMQAYRSNDNANVLYAYYRDLCALETTRRFVEKEDVMCGTCKRREKGKGVGVGTGTGTRTEGGQEDMDVDF
jgi:hypothetical protein